MRRNSDQLITAHITGMQPAKAQLFAHYQSASAWEQVAMQRTPSSGAGVSYQFLFAGLPENVEYYVTAGPLVSPHYKMRAVDLPAVKEIQVTYHYPAWTRMKPVTEEHSGDLRAIEGTDAVIQVRTDQPLKGGQLVMDGGQTIHLTAGPGNTYQGSIHMEKDGVYYVVANDEGQSVRLSEDYFIATDKAMPPEITIVRPGGDYRATPIEEVALGVKASDEFGLEDMHLHYSVNGGPIRDVNLLKVPDAKSADGAYTLALEDFKLVPGDLVSLYATARDGHSEARTDISFIQVDPFEREFSQSQQSDGGASAGGGQSNDQTEISRREKELIAATWKQQNDKTATPGGAAAQGQFLSQAQRKLRDQVNALSVRMQSRDISEANQEFTDFDKYMRDAASAMDPAADKLLSTQWGDAIPLEQRALQALLHAEATLRQIQVAFGQLGGGGGGNAGRDLASLFDLELDTAKNQYETAQSVTPAERHEKAVEDTLAKLDALARRQQDLANQQQNPQQFFQQRWEQEMLRREAEQLQRQLEQLAEKGLQGSSGSQSRQSSEQPSSSPQNSSGRPTSSDSRSDSKTPPGSQSAREHSGNAASASSSGSLAEPQIAQALNRLQQAINTMRNSSDPGRDRTNAQNAAEQLRQASNLLAATQQRLASEKVDSLAREANRLSHEESIQAGRINKFVSQDAPSLTDLNAMLTRRRELMQLAQDRQRLSNELSDLQRNIRAAAKEMAPNQPGVAQSLRAALTEMDNSDLDNHMQRTADWLRRGVDPTTRGTEDEIAQELAMLSQRLQQASKGMGQAKQREEERPEQDQAELMDQVERLRNYIESLTHSRGDNRRVGQNGQAGRSSQTDQNSQRQLSRNGHVGSGQAGQQQGFDSSQLGRNRHSPSAANGPQDLLSGDLGNRNRNVQSGDVREGEGGSVDGAVWNNINTGNNHYGHPRQQSTPTDVSGNPPDVEGDYQQGMHELTRLWQKVKDDPQAAKDIAELTRQMQRLDPSRFPGNPAMLEEMHREILSSLDRLELQLQHDGISPQARTGRPYSVPPGYKDSVTEYYRRLSKSQ